MKVRIHRRVRRPPDLTSLFDVLFIVVFVALIRAAAAQHAEAEATKPVPKPVTQKPAPVSLDVATLKARALASINADLAQREPIVMRISEQGVVTEIEAGGKKLALDVPLIEANTNPRIEFTYLGERSAQLRMCRIAALNLNLPDLEHHFVMIAPSSTRAERQFVLNAGLERDLVRCLVEQRGVATIVEPTP